MWYECLKNYCDAVDRTSYDAIILDERVASAYTTVK